MSRSDTISNWLDAHNAIRSWHHTFKTANGTHQITHYVINGHSCLVHETASGWELYVPASDSTLIARTFNDAEKRLGLPLTAFDPNL